MNDANNTRLDRYLDNLRDHKWISVLLLVALVVIGFATVTDALKKSVSTVTGWLFSSGESPAAVSYAQDEAVRLIDALDAYVVNAKPAWDDVRQDRGSDDQPSPAMLSWEGDWRLLQSRFSNIPALACSDTAATSALVRQFRCSNTKMYSIYEAFEESHRAARPFDNAAVFDSVRFAADCGNGTLFDHRHVNWEQLQDSHIEWFQEAHAQVRANADALKRGIRECVGIR